MNQNNSSTPNTESIIWHRGVITDHLKKEGFKGRKLLGTVSARLLEKFGQEHTTALAATCPDLEKFLRQPAYVRSEQELVNHAPAPQTEEEVYAELYEKYATALITSAQLETLSITPRLNLIGSWMKEGDTGFVYGNRGSGKTWFVDAIATHLSAGKELFDWPIPKAHPVLYVDAEMPVDDARDRLKGMSPKNDNLIVLHHEILFDRTGLAMELTNQNFQRVLTQQCVERVVKLLILDNLSSLSSLLPENDPDAWGQKMTPWLLDMRRRKIAVLLVHHSSRAGTMRGTYRREDNAFWVIRVDEIKARQADERGAHFEIRFEKFRNDQTVPWSKRLSFQIESDGQVSIGWEDFSIQEKILQLIIDGLESASDIAQELGVDKSTVSKHAKILQDKKLISIQNRRYKPRGALKE